MADNPKDPSTDGRSRLPYRATTASGNQFDFEFPLHPETASAVHVANVLSCVLEALDREIKLQGQIGNGDVLQGLCMAVAVRARMLGSRQATVAALAKDLLETALAASAEEGPGNVSTDHKGPLH